MHGNVQPKLALVGCHGDSPPPSLYHSISPPMHPCRNEWEPPDKKVDTRKYRAEPKSIFEYEPGKSSVLKLGRPVWCSLYIHVWLLVLVVQTCACRLTLQELVSACFTYKDRTLTAVCLLVVLLSDLGRWFVLATLFNVICSIYILCVFAHSAHSNVRI